MRCTAQPGSYSSAGVSPETKLFAAQLAVALKPLGVTIPQFASAASSTLYQVTKRSLQRHVAAVERGGNPFTDEKESGRRPTLTHDQWMVVSGAVLAHTKNVSDSWIRTWLWLNFGVKVDLSTVSRHMQSMSMTVQLSGKRPLPLMKTTDDVAVEYHQFVLDLHNRGVFKRDHSTLVCLDFVTNSRRTERGTTRQVKGSAQKKKQRVAVDYTDSYLIALTADGERTFESLFFTFNPVFDRDGDEWGHVKRWLKEYHIEEWRIIYGKSKKQYCKECSDQVSHFQRLYNKELRGMTVLHDDGNAFKRGSDLILEDGSQEVFVFPSLSHGFLSPCDNKANAVAKAMWRAERPPDNEAKAALHLLWCFDWLKKDSLVNDWSRNFFLGRDKLTLNAVKDRLQCRNKSNDFVVEHEAKYSEAYIEWKEEHEERVPSDDPIVQQTELDGPYWQ